MSAYSEFEDFEPQVAEVVDDPTRPYKAYAGAVVAAVTTFVAFWVGDDDPFTKKDAGEAFIAALAAAAPGFGLPYLISNPRTVKIR